MYEKKLELVQVTKVIIIRNQAMLILYRPKQITTNCCPLKIRNENFYFISFLNEGIYV